MNGIIYCRVSSDEQVKGTSLESQESACREYADAKDIRVLKVFIERGESAKFAERTQLLELIDFCRKNKDNIEVLLVWKIDRFARNVTDHFNVKATLAKYGVRIVSVTEPIDTNPEGKLMETILAGFAQFDNDIRAMRTVQGMRRKLQEGIFPWKPPLGYTSPALGGEKKTRPDEPDSRLFAPVQKAWKAFVTGAYTKAEIRRLLASWGVVAASGAPLPAQSVDNLFRNPYYAGILVDPWSGQEYEGQHVPMITREEFLRVQHTINRRNRSIPHQKERAEFPLRGIARCGGCEQYLTGSLSRGRSRRYAYYHCNQKDCRRRSRPAESIHSEFAAFLDELTPKSALFEKTTQMLLEEIEERRALQKTKSARLDREVAAIKAEFQELIRMRARSLIGDQEFLAQKTLLVQRQAALEARKAQIAVSPEDIRQQLAEVKQPLLQLRTTWRELPLPLQKRFERLVFPAGFVEGRIRTAETALLFAVFKQPQDTDSTVVARAGALWNRVFAEIKAFWQLVKEYRAGLETSTEAVRT